jgi:hypothetical protein
MISKLFAEQRPLMVSGLICLLLVPVFGLLMVFDDTQILGINRWIKPIKFLTSITIFVWTIAVLLQHLKGFPRTSRFTSWSIVFILSVEMLIIIVQAARGTTSHFNIKAPIDGLLFGIMGILIVSNTLVIAYLLILFFTAEIDLSPTVVWGIRLGILVFLLGSIEGGYMSTQLGHAVGVKDGGPGLPLVNWSTVAGDLRVAHFFGLHAIQVIPLFSLFVDRFRLPLATPLTFVFAAGYLAFFSFLFLQALKGQPFLSQLLF